MSSTQAAATADERLREVFNLVCNPTNWKLPIDATIFPYEATRDEISEAVIFFTGSAPTITAVEVPVRPHPTALVTMRTAMLSVKASGYYAAVGA